MRRSHAIRLALVSLSLLVLLSTLVSWSADRDAKQTKSGSISADQALGTSVAVPNGRPPGLLCGRGKGPGNSSGSSSHTCPDFSGLVLVGLLKIRGRTLADPSIAEGLE